jgi:primosomal protein N' (replication factor Y)
MGRATRIARVLPDVTGLDREFDYVVPGHLDGALAVGDIVRISLHRRRITGWVVDFPDSSAVDGSRLLQIEARLGSGPSADIVDLARWAARRWSGRVRPMLVAGSPQRRIPRLPPARRSTQDRSRHDEWDELVAASSPVLVQRGPRFDGLAVINALARRGPVLVVVPTMSRVRGMVAQLRRLGMTVAALPDEWESAAGGVDVVVGARSAVWARVEGLAGILVVDEHDDSLQEERSPCWHARSVAIERARRLGVPCVLLSPIPSVAANAVAATVSWEVGREWPTIEIVDRTTDEQWSKSLVSSRLIELIRDPSLRVVVVHNAKGRSQLMACASCREVAVCEHCSGPMGALDDGTLTCRRCARERPAVCGNCGSSSLANLRPGVGRLVQDLLKASGRAESDVCAVTSASVEIDQTCGLFVGTEAVLHRVRQPDVVVFADFDQELLAPRYRASEIAASLVVAAARRVGSGRVLIQTHTPRHPLLRALGDGSIEQFVQSESSTRQLLGLPPYGAIALVKGAGAAGYTESLSGSLLLDVSTKDDVCLVRSRSLDTLLEALESHAPPKGAKVTVQVDPPRV